MPLRKGKATLDLGGTSIKGAAKGTGQDKSGHPLTLPCKPREAGRGEGDPESKTKMKLCDHFSATRKHKRVSSAEQKLDGWA